MQVKPTILFYFSATLYLLRHYTIYYLVSGYFPGLSTILLNLLFIFFLLSSSLHHSTIYYLVSGYFPGLSTILLNLLFIYFLAEHNRNFHLRARCCSSCCYLIILYYFVNYCCRNFFQYSLVEISFSTTQYHT